MTFHPAKTSAFTGRHMAMVMLLFFGVIIAINVIMASFANRSWTGFVVRNSYVASQQFNRRAAEGRAQAALGWSGRLSISSAKLIYRLRDAQGDSVHASKVTVSFRRPVSDRDDGVVILQPAPGESFEADFALKDGIWILEINVEAGLLRPYREFRRILIKNGVAP